MKQTLQRFLAILSRKILSKYKPKIIGITGSVGKTSAKEAIFLVVSQTFRARKPEKNFNNEFGVPFTVIGVDSPRRSAAKWVALAVKALGLIIFRQRYPEVLVLEMGIDRPGDMDYLLSIAHPNIAVITNIGISHYEFFHDEEAIEREKGKIAQALRDDDILIVNADNAVALRQREKTETKTITYSAAAPADITLSVVSESFREKFSTSFIIKTGSKEFSACINAIGSVHLSAVASAVAVATALGMDISSIKKGVEQYRAAPGRLSILPGIKHSVLIDDTYNASPDSMKEALGLLQRIPAESKLAVLGDMLELGRQSDAAHRAVGKMAGEMHLDHLLTVGPNGKIMADAAREYGMLDDKILSFDTADDARKTVQDLLRPGAVALIKGSQGIRLEKVTAEIMAEPMKAHELLCRHYGAWISR